MPALVTVVVITAILYFGRDIFIPISVAILLTFALAPIVGFLRKRGLPRILAVIATVLMAFMAIALFAVVLATQVTSLAQNLPTYQSNIIEKIDSLKQMGKGGGIIDQVTSALNRVGQELQESGPGEEAGESNKPLPVEVVTRQSPIDILTNIVVPLISPFATAGLVIVVVIFMLLEREDLRDRFIRLAGAGDLNKTTEALHDAGKRVGRYLLMQLVINTTYAIPITLGLWLIGVPNALLWGVLTLVLRFVPYIGPAIGMILPMFVAFAALPGWTPLIATAALFIGVELLSNNVMEPWLYGSNTGLSPLAIIVSAIFWGWLWGPIGLVLSTPLTVCLVVLGKHVPQFEFFSVMFGNRPVLEPSVRIYQRLLAGDPDEAVDHAEDILEDQYLVDFYDGIGVPALLQAEEDRLRGVMNDEARHRFAAAALALVGELEAEANSEEEDDSDEEEDADDLPRDSDGKLLPDGEGRSLIVVGGRTELDDALAAMAAQSMATQGAQAVFKSHEVLRASKSQVDLTGVDTVVLSYLNPAALAWARLAVRRIKRLEPRLRVGLLAPGLADRDQPFDAATIGADFAVLTIADAIARGFADEKPVQLKPDATRRRRQVKAGRKAKVPAPA
ncbi:MAG: AI-2E family transporter [Mesorhizobium sp.]